MAVLSACVYECMYAFGYGRWISEAYIYVNSKYIILLVLLLLLLFGSKQSVAI